MADLLRSADAEWKGDLKGGNGTFSASSGAFTNLPYSYMTRFEDNPGTNPEELIAAAQASCYSMAFANVLAKKGYNPESIRTHATTFFSEKEGGGRRVSRLRLDVEGKVQGLDQATFQQIALEAEKACPVSNLLRPGVDAIEVNAKLVG